MRQRLYHKEFDGKNNNSKSVRIVVGNKPSARFTVLSGGRKWSKQARKTKKSAADLLEVDDARRKIGKGFLSDAQRQQLIIKADDKYKTTHTYKSSKVSIVEKRRRDETAEVFIGRLLAKKGVSF